MLTERKIPSKLEQIEQRYTALRFERLADIPMQMAETLEHFRQEPGPEANLAWQPAAPGLKWGDTWVSAWFRGDITLPESAGGRRLFVRAQTGGETLFFVDGCPRGVFDLI